MLYESDLPGRARASHAAAAKAAFKRIISLLSGAEARLCGAPPKLEFKATPYQQRFPATATTIALRYFPKRIRIQRLLRRLQESVHAGRADRNQAESEREADIAKAAARLFTGGDAPLRGEQPQAVAEMPGSGDDADRVKGDHPRILKFCLDLGERLHGMRRQVHAGEAQEIGVLHHVDERDDAGPALRGVEPVARPGIIGDVGLALIPDIDAVEAVVKDRNPDEEQLEAEKRRAGCSETRLACRRL